MSRLIILLALITFISLDAFIEGRRKDSVQETAWIVLQDRILMAQDHLREDNPDVDEGCIITASYIQLGLYEQVEHMMEPFGRCATKVLGMRPDPEEYIVK